MDSQARKTILLADNDPNFLKARSALLRAEGFQVITAQNPTEARKALRKHEINLAVIDVRLLDDGDESDHSGFDLAREECREIPVVVITDFSSVENVREALAKHIAQDFIAKEDGVEELVLAIRRIFRKPEPKTGPRQVTSEQLMTQTAFQELLLDFKDASRKYNLLFWAQYILAILGASVILIGVVLVFLYNLNVGVWNAVAGAVACALSAFFTKLASIELNRKKRYQTELLGLLPKKNVPRKHSRYPRINDRPARTKDRQPE